MRHDRLTSRQTAAPVIQATVKAFGKVDGIVINHGVLTPLSRIADSNPEEWRRCYDINVMSALALVRYASRNLRLWRG